MSVNVQLMSGDILSFEINDEYKVGNLRGAFYNRMAKELSIKDIECIVVFNYKDMCDILDIFENPNEDLSILNICDISDICDMNDFVKAGNTYRILVNNPCISLFYDDVRDSIRVEHVYEIFPSKAIVKMTDSVKQNMENTYRHLYDELVDGFQYDIDIFNDNLDNYYDLNMLPTFNDYVENKYGSIPEIEDIVKEYIRYFISNRFEIEDFVYE